MRAGLPRIAVITLAALLATACDTRHGEELPGESRATETVVARVDGAPITLAELRAHAAAQAPGQALEDLDPGRRQALLDELIHRHLLASRALALGLDREPMLQLALARQRQLLLAAAAERQLATQLEPVSEEQLRTRYAAELARAHPLEYRVEAVSFAAEAAAREFIARLDGGADFTHLATEQAASDDGVLFRDGWFGEADLPASIFHEVAGMAPGQRSTAPFAADAAWHALRVVASRPAVFASYAEMEPLLRALLQREALLAEVARLRQAASIEITAESSGN